jgi:hypothetical protein
MGAFPSQLVMPTLCRASTSLLCHRKTDEDGRDIGAKQSFVASPGDDEK